MPAVIRPEKLLRELDELWVSLGQQGNGESTGVLRACSMTLVVATESDEELGETLAELMRNHPARAIVLRVHPEADMRAHVYAQCWMPFGRRQQICCEQVEIASDSQRLTEVAPVIRALTAPDLMKVAWCRSAGLVAALDAAGILAMADKVVVDSAGAPDLRAQAARLTQLRRSGRTVADLAWTRLTRWRETIAQMFDNPAYLGRRDEIGAIAIDWEGDHLPMAAAYVLAWFRQALGRSLTARIRRVGDSPRSRLRCVRFTRPGSEASLTVGQNRAAEVAAGGPERHMILPLAPDSELLSEELAILGLDPVFEATLVELPAAVEAVIAA